MVDQTELDQSQQEIERLRGLLLERDEELGTAKGRLAEMESYAGFFMGLVRRLQARAPFLAKAAREVLRLLRRLTGRKGG